VAPRPRGRRLTRALAAPIETRVSTDRWLVSYADLLTLLFALFAVMVALSQRRESKLEQVSQSIRATLAGQRHSSPPAAAHPEPRVPQPPSMDRLAAELRTVLAKTAGSGAGGQVATVEESPEGLVLSFPESGLFASGAARLLPGTGAGIVAAGQVLAARGASLRVEGHSDDQPIANELYHSNWELSAARAMAVLTLLVNQAGYTPTHLSMAGYGPYRPVASNSSPEGRSRNRRVNLVVLGTEPAMPTPGPARPQ
jgi:chemotaxis protein MotB